MTVQGNPFIRAMTANVASSKKNNYKNDPKLHWDYRLGKIARIFSFYKPDVIALQEVDRRQAEDLKYSLNTRGDLYALAGRANRHGYYCSILYNTSRVKMVACGCFYLSPNGAPEPAFGSSFVHIVSWFKLSCQGKDFFVVTTRLDGITGPNKTMRTDGCKILVKQMRQIVEKTPALLMGDFNFFPDAAGNKGYQILKQLGDDIRDLTDEHCGPQGTFCGFLGDQYTPQPHQQPERLDYIFASNFPTVIREGVAAKNVHPETQELYEHPGTRSDLEPPPSDHYFPFADVALT